MAIQTVRETVRELSKPSKVRALDVEALLQWAYADQRVHEAVADEARPMRLTQSGRTSTAVVSEVLAMGCVIDRSAFKPVTDVVENVARDALAVDALVRETGREMAGLVQACAVRATRPEAYVGITPRLVPRVRGKNGRPVMVYADAKCRKPVLCPLDYAPSPEEISAGRGRYRRWWLALDWLAEYLPDVLNDHVITGFAAPQEPWEIETLDVGG